MLRNKRRSQYALTHPSFSRKLSGIVEMDETYVGGKSTGKGKGWDKKFGNKSCVVSLLERGGEKRSMVFDKVTAENLQSAILEHVEEGSILMTDEHPGYKRTPKAFVHKPVRHYTKEYVWRENGLTVTTNTIESSFSLLKRGIVGTFHQVSKKHLPLYLAEFDHRYNNRKVSDGERTVSALKMAEGKRLTLKPLKGKKV